MDSWYYSHAAFESHSLTNRLLAGLTSQLTHRPDAIALTYYSTANQCRHISWRGLADEACSRALLLRKTVRPGSLIFVIHHDPLNQLQWWLASLFADAVPGILTPPTTKIDRNRYRYDLDLLLSSHPEALVLYGPRVFTAKPHGRSIDLTDWIGESAAETTILRSTDPSEPIIFQQSSGTTGRRKGILLSEAAVVNQLHAYCESLEIRSDDRILSWLPLYHDMGLIACLCLSIYAGLTLVLTSPFVWLGSPHWWVSAALKHRPTLTWLPNFALNLMVDRVRTERFANDALTSFRGVINCSEPILQTSLLSFERHFGKIGLKATALSSCYAMAENTFAVTQTPLGTPIALDIVDSELLERSELAVPLERGRAFASSGQAIPGTRVRIMSAERICNDREVGDILIQSLSLISGYEMQGEILSSFAPHGWFRTGDVGYLVAGELFVIARRQDVIIRAGRNLDPTIFEAAVSSVPGVKPGRVVAIGNLNAQTGTEDLIIIAESSLDQISNQDMVASILSTCEAQTGTVPQKILIVATGWLPKSSSGKISRGRSKNQYIRTLLAPATP